MQEYLTAISYSTGVLHNSELGMFYPKLHNTNKFHLVYAGFVGATISCLNKRETELYREKLVKDVTPGTIVYFDCAVEGVVIRELIKIHELIKGIIDEQNVYYVTSALNAQELYKEFADKEKIEDKINIKVVSWWEHYVQRSATELDSPQYVIKEKEKVFVCLNRIARYHRLGLLGLMLHSNLINKGYYSYLNTVHVEKRPQPTIADRIDNLRNHFREDIFRVMEKNIKCFSNNIPLKLDIDPDRNIVIVRSEDINYYSNSYFSLVTETFYHSSEFANERPVFFSEKIFKPIAMKHPFILVSPPGYLKELRKLGYKTFSGIINESYNNIVDDTDRLVAIVNEVRRLSTQTPEQWIKWQTRAKDIVEYNYNVLMSKQIEDFVIG